MAEDLVKQLDAAVLDAGETERRAHLLLRAQCAEAIVKRAGRI